MTFFNSAVDVLQTLVIALGTAQSLSIGDKLETGFTDATPRIGRR